jgi:hypothetical protein
VFLQQVTSSASPFIPDIFQPAHPAYLFPNTLPATLCPQYNMLTFAKTEHLFSILDFPLPRSPTIVILTVHRKNLSLRALPTCLHSAHRLSLIASLSPPAQPPNIVMLNAVKHLGRLAILPTVYAGGESLSYSSA